MERLKQCIGSIGSLLDIPAHRLEAWIENIVQVLERSKICSVGDLVAAAEDGTKWRVDGVSTVFWSVAESYPVLRDASVDAKSNDVPLSSDYEEKDNQSTKPDEKERYRCGEKEKKKKKNKKKKKSAAKEKQEVSTTCQGVGVGVRAGKGAIIYLKGSYVSHYYSTPPTTVSSSPREGKRIGFADDFGNYSSNLLARPDVLNCLRDLLVDQKMTKLVLSGLSGSGRTSAVKWFTNQDDIRRYFVGGLYYFDVANSTIPFEDSVTLSGEEMKDLKNALIDLQYEVFITLSFGSKASGCEFESRSWQGGLRLLDSLVWDLTKPMLLVIDNVSNADVVDALTISQATCLFLTNALTLRSRLQPDCVYDVYELPLLDKARRRELFLMKYRASWDNFNRLERRPAVIESDITESAIEGSLKDLTLRAGFLGRGFSALVKPLDNLKIYLDDFDSDHQWVFRRFVVLPLNLRVPRSLFLDFFERTLPFREFGFLLDDLCSVGLLDSFSDQTISLHESLYQALRPLILESTQQQFHLEIVEFYHSKCGGEWWRMENDGYFYRHIQHHMRMAGPILSKSKLDIAPLDSFAKMEMSSEQTLHCAQFIVSAIVRGECNLSLSDALDQIISSWSTRSDCIPIRSLRFSQLLHVLAIIFSSLGIESSDSVSRLRRGFSSLDRDYLPHLISNPGLDVGWRLELLLGTNPGEEWSEREIEYGKKAIDILFPSRAMEVQVSGCLSEKLCTFSVTGMNNAHQLCYRVPPEEFLVCQSCAAICYQNATPTNNGLTEAFYCECGAGDSCQLSVFRDVPHDASVDAKSNDVSLSSDYEKKDNQSTKPDEKERATSLPASDTEQGRSLSRVATQGKEAMAGLASERLGFGGNEEQVFNRLSVQHYLTPMATKWDHSETVSRTGVAMSADLSDSASHPLFAAFKNLDWPQAVRDLLTISDWIDQNGDDYVFNFMFLGPASEVNTARSRLSRFWNTVFLDYGNVPALLQLSHPSRYFQMALNYFNTVEPLDEAVFKKISPEVYWNGNNRHYSYEQIDKWKVFYENPTKDDMKYRTKRDRLLEYFGRSYLLDEERILFFSEFADYVAQEVKDLNGMNLIFNRFEQRRKEERGMM